MADVFTPAQRSVEMAQLPGRRGAGSHAGMSLTISIPDDFADVLGASAEERDRRAREALALDLYREGKISLRRMGELAGVRLLGSGELSGAAQGSAELFGRGSGGGPAGR